MKSPSMKSSTVSHQIFIENMLKMYLSYWMRFLLWPCVNVAVQSSVPDETSFIREKDFWNEDLIAFLCIKSCWLYTRRFHRSSGCNSYTCMWYRYRKWPFKVLHTIFLETLKRAAVLYVLLCGDCSTRFGISSSLQLFWPLCFRAQSCLWGWNMTVSVKLLSVRKNVVWSSTLLVGNSSLCRHAAVEALPSASPKNKRTSAIWAEENRLVASSIIKGALTYCRNWTQDKHRTGSSQQQEQVTGNWRQIMIRFITIRLVLIGCWYLNLLYSLSSVWLLILEVIRMRYPLSQ
jgi:hypothetical protein